MTKIYLKTFGCQMNEYDSSRMLDLLHKTHGITPATSPEEASILVLNTCSIREKAHEKVFSELGRWYKLKQKNPDILIGITGCVASQEGNSIRKRAPYVDFVLGPQTIHRLPDVIDKLQTAKNTIVDISFPEIEKFDNLPEPVAKGPSAYVSIMEGCNKYCTYCIVPYTRGREISRPLADILTEINSLKKQEVKEITLLGQNVNAYRGQTANGNTADLALLITNIAEIKEIERIKFMTSHPVEFSENLIQTFKTTPKLSSHLHLPVQSGSNRILKLMGRGHTIEEFKDKIFQLRKIRNNLSISSDFIIGFPGETEQDFVETLQLVKDINLDQSFSFIYSKRPGTKAANYPDNVPLATKKERLGIIQAVIKEQAKAISQSMIETTQRVLVTGKSKDKPNVFFGKTDNNRTVYFDATNITIGQIINTHICKVIANSLYGKIQ